MHCIHNTFTLLELALQVITLHQSVALSTINNVMAKSSLPSCLENGIQLNTVAETTDIRGAA